MKLGKLLYEGSLTRLFEKTPDERKGKVIAIVMITTIGLEMGGLSYSSINTTRDKGDPQKVDAIEQTIQKMNQTYYSSIDNIVDFEKQYIALQEERDSLLQTQNYHTTIQEAEEKDKPKKTAGYIMLGLSGLILIYAASSLGYSNIYKAVLKKREKKHSKLLS